MVEAFSHCRRKVEFSGSYSVGINLKSAILKEIGIVSRKTGVAAKYNIPPWFGMWRTGTYPNLDMISFESPFIRIHRMKK